MLCRLQSRIGRGIVPTMSSLYHLDASSAEIARRFGADAGPDPWAGGAIMPGQFAPVITRSGRTGRKVIRPMHWGYPPPGDLMVPGAGPTRWVTHVRNLESPFWIGNLRHRELRCLVPVTRFAVMPTTAPPKGQPKRPEWFSLPDQPIFALAGIWRDLTDMPVFAFLTTEPNAILRPIKAATMPVILHADDHDTWLGADWKEAQELAVPFPSQLMQRSEGG